MAIIELWFGQDNGLNFESGSKGKIKVGFDNYYYATRFIEMVLYELHRHVESYRSGEELEKREIILQEIDEIITKVIHLHNKHDLMKFFRMR